MASAVVGALRVTLGLDSAQFLKGLDDTSKRLRAVGGDMKKVGKNLTLYLTAPLAAAGAATIKMSGDFEAAMIRVGISSQAGAADMQAMNDLALQLGKDTIFGAGDAADAMDELAKSGLSARQILDGAATAAVNLAAAAGSDLSPAAHAITDVMQQFGLTTAQLPEAINQITGAVNESKLGFDDFALAIGQAGGVAGGLGVSFTDFNAALAGTSALFASGSDAGTSFKTFLTRFTPQTEQAADLMKQYGLSFFEASGQMKSMSAIAEMLRTGLSGLDDQAKTEVLKKVFGTDAMRTAIGLMKLGGEGLDQIKAKIAATDAAAQSAKRLSGFNGQMEQLKGAAETLAIKIGQSGLLGAVTGMVKALGDFIDRLSELNPDVLKWGVYIAAAAASIGPLLVALGAIVGAIGTLTPVIVAVGGALATISSIIVMGVLPAIGSLLVALAPILIPLAAVAAAVGAVYLAWKHWDKIVPILRSLYTAVKTWIMDKLGAVWTWLKDKISAVGDWFFNLYDRVVGHSYIPDMVTEIGQNIARLETVMVQPAQSAAERTAAAFEQLKADVGGILSSLFPDEGRLAGLKGDLAKLDKALADKLIDPAVWGEARGRLAQQIRDLETTVADRREGEIVTPVGVSQSLVTPEMLKRTENGLDNISAKFGELRDEGSKAMVDLVNNALNALSQLGQAIKGGGFLNILGAGFNAFGSLSKAGAFGGGLKKAFVDFSGIQGFATGGSFKVGGASTVGDKNLVQFRANAGELVDIRKPGNDAGGGRVTIVPSPYFEAVVDARATAVAAPLAQAAVVGGAAMAQSRMVRAAGRRLGR